MVGKMRNFKQNYYDSDLTYRGTDRVRIYTSNGQKTPLEAKKAAFKDIAIHSLIINQVEKIKPFKRKSKFLAFNENINNVDIWNDNVQVETDLLRQEVSDSLNITYEKP
jgi:hypothetical protein